MTTTELEQQRALALIDADLAWAESERDRTLQLWARERVGTLRERAQRQALDALDREIAGLNATRHRLVCAMRGESHLKALPALSGATRRTA